MGRPLRIAVAAAALAVSLSACGPATTERTVADQSTAVGRSAAISPDFTVVDLALVRGLAPTVYADESRNLRAEVPMIATARQMTSAMEVLRERGLRVAAWDQATKVSVDYHVVASGPGVLGIVVTPTWTAGDQDRSQPVLVWYDAGSKRVFSSPILIREDQWAAFSDELRKAAKKHRKVKKDRLDDALGSAPAPQGSGPMLGFAPDGALVAQFGAGTVTDEAVAVRVPPEKAAPFLSDFGRRAAAASVGPAAFDGTPAPGAEPVEAAAVESASGRPSTAVGPDCRQLTCVALTYDDGPAEGTPKVLQALQQAKAPATFFHLGRMIEAHPTIAKQVASDGNEVASHTVTHPDLSRIGAEQVTRELVGNAGIMEQTYGRKPMLLRPPYGSHNQAVDEAVRASGAAIIMWDADTFDWRTRDAGKTEDAAVNGKGVGPNAIVLMHDIHASTVAATPGILAGLQRKGVTLVTVSELSLNAGGYSAGRTYTSGTAAGPVSAAG
ncbi:MAG: polysaccharide deacetylase family protein [Propionibacteriaceae bacterium]|nr:polysaccharide deacetylase family protein [Propionibacteriaceae bacterium]